MPRSIRPLLLICALALLVPAAASAQAPVATEIDGSPLNVWTDPTGSIQASVDGYGVGEWYPISITDPDTGNQIPDPNANAGFGLVVDPDNGGYRFGRFIAGTMGEPSSGPTLTPGNPATITTTWQQLDQSGGPLVDVTQVLSYTNGQRQFDAQWTVHNASPNPLQIRPSVAGDMAIRGSDTGIGFITGEAPNRFIGGVNQEVGAAGGFLENPSSPWSHFEVSYFGQVGSHAADGTLTGGMDNSLAPERVDFGAGVQWDDHLEAQNALAPGASAVYKVSERFIDTLGLTPPSDHKLTGETATLTAKVGDLNGNNAGDRTIDYTVFGSNNLSGKLKTGADGKATISYVGGAPGQDQVVAFTDLNGNSQRDDNEPQATATIDWEGPPAPVIGVSAGVRPVGNGTVKIKLPPGFSGKRAKAMGLHGAASGFVKLTSALQVPMGSTLDTTHGKVNLLSAASSNSLQGKFQSGNFNGTQFKVTQNKKKPLTQLSMLGGGLKSCSTVVPKGGSAARKHRRRLFTNAHGHFRTRGRNSSATVRGTKFSMTDTCGGTLTVVNRGSVKVRNFTLKKTKVVKAGHRYFAKAPKRKNRLGK